MAHTQNPAVTGPIDPDWAWHPYEPDAKRPWNLTWAGHLWRRAAFGGNWHELQETLANGPQRSIDRLLRPEADIRAFNQRHDGYEIAAAGGESTDNLRSWWLRRMIHTPHPLLEKMTLFWHSYFGISNARVKNARLMQQHVQSLRAHALGSFSDLLKAMPSDPAVLLSLDCTANRKAQVNVNLARALMENYSLEPGMCAEEDIQQAARALTGWFVMRGKLRYIAREHDAESKSILGRHGRFTGPDVTQILLDHPATARRVVGRLYAWLISETRKPDPSLVQPLAESFARDYDLGKVVETMLRSNLFFSARAYGQRVKCPLEFAIGIVRGLEGMLSTTQLGQDLADLGQNLYYPPTQKGWPGGEFWIDTAALTARHNLAVSLLGTGKPYAGKLNPWALAQKHRCSTPAAAGLFISRLFLQQGDAHTGEAALADAGQASADGAEDPEVTLRRFTQGLVTQAEFHLA